MKKDLKEFYYLPYKIDFMSIIANLAEYSLAEEIGITANSIDSITGADARRAFQRGWELADTVDTADSATVLKKNVKYIELKRPGVITPDIEGIIFEFDNTLYWAQSDKMNNLSSKLTELTIQRGKSIWKTTNAGRNWELIVGSGKRWLDGTELKELLK